MYILLLLLQSWSLNLFAVFMLEVKATNRTVCVPLVCMAINASTPIFLRIV
ncbi:hypothetical protein Fmac_021623 [Flemingia macrophylla]|uniref:Uncharacterized protein n=1 Tax=Flemingia macrophylla TaxID=520843 RepID=A0ABD1LXE9_9FABA